MNTRMLMEKILAFKIQTNLTILSFDELYNTICTMGDSLGFAMVPGGRPLLGGGVIGISKASKNREAACEFLKWVYSDEISGMITALGGIRGTETQHYPQFNQKVFENILGTAVRNCVTGIMPVQDALDYAQKILEQNFKYLITTHKTYNS